MNPIVPCKKVLLYFKSKFSSHSSKPLKIFTWKAKLVPLNDEQISLHHEFDSSRSTVFPEAQTSGDAPQILSTIINVCDPYFLCFFPVICVASVVQGDFGINETRLTESVADIREIEAGYMPFFCVVT